MENVAALAVRKIEAAVPFIETIPTVTPHQSASQTASPLRGSRWQREFRCAVILRVALKLRIWNRGLSEARVSHFASSSQRKPLAARVSLRKPFCGARFPKDILNGKPRASHAVCVACPKKCFTIRPRRWRQGAAGGTKRSCDAFELL